MKKTLLWIAAVALMISAVIYQRTTGPTYPFRGNIVVEGESYKYRLIRSEETTRQARVVLPNPKGDKLSGALHYKRYKTADSLTVAPLVKEGEEWVAYLPKQPAAGKMEYFVTLAAGGESMRIPAEGEENII